MYGYESETSYGYEIDTIVHEILRVDSDAFDDDTSFGLDGLDADSLAVVEMAETIGMDLGVDIPDDDFEDLQTVGDVKTYVREHAD